MRHKSNIVLDLDQTLISSEIIKEFDFTQNKEKSKKFNFHNMDEYYLVFERPGLQSFLDNLFENFNVSIWTAASKDYALFIIEKIILKNNPKRKLDWVFFSYHCRISKNKSNKSKDLSLLWDIYKIDGFNKNNTIIIDDYDEVYNSQPKNCIKIEPFEFTNSGSEYDAVLEKITKKLGKKFQDIV